MTESQREADLKRLIGNEDEFLAAARKRFAAVVEAEADERQLQEEDLRFGNLEQWDQTIKAAREGDPEGARPCLVVDKLNQYVRQVVNDIRQNRPSAKVRPRDGDGRQEVAEIIGGIMRHIADESRADMARDWAAESAARIGQGFWRLRVDYDDYDENQQRICIDRIPSRFAVYLDPSRRNPDGSDAEYGFLTEDMTREELKARYPDSEISSWSDASGSGDPMIADWHGEQNVRVAEYFCKVWETKAKRRRCRVVHATITGDAILESTEWMAPYIPILETCGNEVFIDGKRMTSGVIRPGKDPQRMYNYMRSTAAEVVALAPRAPFVGAEGQFEGHEARWRQANRRNFAYLEYKPISLAGQAMPPPQRQPFAGVPSGIMNDMQVSEHDIRTAIGMYAESVGDEGQAKSGRAILAKQKEGDTATFHYADNLARAVLHEARIILHLLPHYYDTRRLVRVLGQDGTSEHVLVDPEAPDAYQEIELPDGSVRKVVNLNIGKYDVTVTAGPSYNTQRMEAADAMTQMLQGNPQILGTHGDLIMKSYDWPMADEMAERFRMMLPPELRPQDGMKKLPPEVLAAMQQVEKAMQAIQQHQQQVAEAERSLESDKAALEKERSAWAAERKVLEAAKQTALLELELANTKAEMARMKDEQAAEDLARKLKGEIENAQAVADDVARSAVAAVQELAPVQGPISDQIESLRQLVAGMAEIQVSDHVADGINRANENKERRVRMRGVTGAEYVGIIDADGNVSVAPVQ